MVKHAEEYPRRSTEQSEFQEQEYCQTAKGETELIRSEGDTDLPEQMGNKWDEGKGDSAGSDLWEGDGFQMEWKGDGEKIKGSE